MRTKNKKIMNRKSHILLCLGIFVSLLSGCGGEYAGKTKEDVVSGSAVSGNAVSGQAVSGGAVSDSVVSGPAVQDEGSGKRVPDKKKSKYRFCNDSHLYYMENGVEPVIEYDLSDGSRREIKFKKGERMESIGAICYVDNDWVWYVKEFDPGKVEEVKDQLVLWDYQTELWRAPVENGKLNAQKEEFVFSDPFVMNKEQIYCDGRYLLYVADTDLYRKYDLKEKKYIYDATLDEDEDAFDILVAVTGGTAFIDGDDGMFRQDLDSSEKIMVTERCFDREVAVTEKDLFYLEESGKEHEYYDKVWQYHLADDSKKKIITDEQIRNVLKTKGILKSSPKSEMVVDNLFATRDYLYIQVNLYWEKNGVSVSKKVVLSQKIGGKNELRYEKGLTECLANPEKNRKTFRKIYDEDAVDDGTKSLFLSRGTCLYMSGEKCFMELYDPEQDKNRVACYDLSSGSMKFLTKEDPDWYVPFYNGVQPGWSEVYLEEVSYDMPNNKKVDWPYCCEDEAW